MELKTGKYIIINSMWKKIVLAISLLSLLSLSSCVYYNLFYNAKQKFKDAERNQANSRQGNRSENKIINRAGPPDPPSISVNDKSLYKAAIDRANKVVMYHPQSKYIDDALWIIGKSRYNMAEFVAADKKLMELIVRDPESDFVDDAYFYIGMSQFWLNDYERANDAFQSVLKLKKSGYKDDAAFTLAYMEYLESDFSNAVALFEKMIKDYRKSDSLATAQFFIAVSYDSLGENLLAIEAYRKIKDFGPSHDLYFDAQYAYGASALKADSIKLGMEIFSNLAKSERYFDKSSIIRLKLAEGMYLSGKIDEAVEEYLKIIEQFPGTEQAAEAYYRLGLIYQNDVFDLAKAKEYYNKTTQEKRDSEFRNLALARSAQIAKLETYRDKLGLSNDYKRDKEKSDSTAVDTLNADSLKVSADKAPVDTLSSLDDSQTRMHGIMDSASIEQLPPAYKMMLERMGGDSLISLTDTTEREIAPDTMMQVSESKDKIDFSQILPDSMLAEISPPVDSAALKEDIEIRFLLAELYNYDLNRPDSALHEYMLLAETYPNSKYAPKALLASAHIYESKGDTSMVSQLYRRVINDYPSTAQAQYASDQSGNLFIPAEFDVLEIYNHGEEYYFRYNQPESALAIFDYIQNTFPESEYAAKSAFSSAWIQSQMHAGDGDSAAYYSFAEITEKYPDTKYANEAKIVMGVEKRAKPEEKKPKLNKQRRLTGGGDTPQDSSQVELEDTMYTGMPWAPRVLDSIAFLYPESLLDEGHREKGKVIYKIKLDLFGNITDHQLLGSSGNTVIDSVAERTLLQTTFDMSSLDDLTLLDGYFRYDIRFEPPRDWEDRRDHADPFDPYKEQRERGP